MRPAQEPPPPRTARLFGRARTLSDLRAALARGSVVTLFGPHGVGKSELALHLLATTEGDEHVFVDLLNARDHDDLVAAIAAGFDVRVCADPVSAIREALIARGGLLVLDRCHHLPSASDLVRALRVQQRPAIVCISGGPLGIPDERAIPVDPLEAVDGMELFVFRSGRVLDSSRDHELVRDIVTLCGGLPAAIELCAAWDESPLQLVRELERRVPRDGALAEIVAWSIERLDRISQTALARASVIEGSFTLATFEAIAELPIDVAAPSVLSTLAARALVSRSPRGDTGFVIAPTVRRIAEAMLSDRERRAALQRHARWFATHYATDVVTRSRERADLVVAHQMALTDPELNALVLAHALVPVLRRHGPLDLARGVVEATLAVGDDPLLRAERLALDHSLAIEATTHPRCALLLGEVLLDRNDAEPAARCFRDAARDPELAPMALRGLAESLRRTGAFDEARTHVERALVLARHHDQPAEVGDLLTLRGAIELERGELHAARADLVEALTILGDRRDERAAAAATASLAEVLAEEGLDETTTLESAIDLARRAGDLRAIARVETLRAVRALVEGRLDVARAALDAAERYESSAFSATLREVIRLRGDLREVTGDGPLVRAHRDRAHARLASVRGEAAPLVSNPSQRIARRTVAPAKCAIARDGARASLAGVELDLERRPTLKQILASLLRARIEHPGRAVSTTDLFAAGWPGEKLSPGAKGDRLRAALQALRELGMRGHIVTLAGGWALDPERAYDVT